MAKKSPRRGLESLLGFAHFCSYLRTETGTKLKVHSFQWRFLRDYFRGVVEIVVILTKKNGKTTILAALALYHAKVIEAAEVLIGAASRDQAGILYRQAEMLIRRSGTEVGKDRYRIGSATFRILAGYREIWCGRSRIRVMAADANTADGVIPTLAIVDELHRHHSDELYGIFRDGLGPRAGRMITISTAGWDMASPLGRIRKAAHKLVSFTRVGTYNHAEADGFAFHEWCLEDGDDLENLDLIKRANPAPWQTVEELTRRRNSPTMTPARWARFAAGIWTMGEEPWLSARVWNALRVDLGGIEPAEPAAAAMIYGVTSAIVVAAPRRDDSVAVWSWITEEQITLPELEAKAVEVAAPGAAGMFNVATFGHDTGLGRSAQLLLERGIPMEEFPLSPQRMEIATTTLKRLIDGKLLRHNGDELLRQHVLAGATKDSERGWRLIQTPETKGLIALAVAVHLATGIETGPAVVVPAGVG